MRLAQLATLTAVTSLLAAGCDVARPVADDAVAECARCHGFPPAAPHPQLADAQPSQCNSCHPTTVAPDGTIVPGGTHMDGVVQGGHPPGWADPAMHGFAADSAISWCTQCHGSDYAGGAAPSCNACHATAGFADWQQNCTFCHGTQTQGYTPADLPKAAPPEGVHGETLVSEVQVGAHQAHLHGGTLSDGVACTECHVIPTDLSHLDGTPRVTFGALATQGSPGAQFDANSATCSSVYCHGATLSAGTSTTPSWTGSVTCDACHGLPPQTGRHEFHMGQSNVRCYSCHSQVAANTAAPGIQATAAAKALHVNGQKDVSLSVTGTWNAANKTCSNVLCHGSVTFSWN